MGNCEKNVTLGKNLEIYMVKIESSVIEHKYFNNDKMLFQYIMILVII